MHSITGTAMVYNNSEITPPSIRSMLIEHLHVGCSQKIFFNPPTADQQQISGPPLAS